MERGGKEATKGVGGTKSVVNQGEEEWNGAVGKKLKDRAGEVSRSEAEGDKSDRQGHLPARSKEEEPANYTTGYLV
jgi:hypothetical protein